MYKVFIQHKALLFENSEKINRTKGLFYSENSAIANKELIFKQVEDSNNSGNIVIFSTNPLSSLKQFFSDFDYVEAAGGIVQRNDRFLFIKRNGIWDLPKGKMDEGESPEKTAIREIAEECGILCQKTEYLITESYHIYEFKGVPTIKKTYWYSMNYDGGKKLSCQAEEGITDAKWVKREDIQKYYDKTFASLQEVLKLYFIL